MFTCNTGTASFTYDHDTHTLHYQLDVMHIVNATAAHIHMGAPDASGDVIVPLFTTASDAERFSGSGNLATGDITNADLTGGMTVEELVCEMLLGNTYVNVHTTQDPAGEIRGQVMMGELPPVNTGSHYSVTLGALNDSGVTGTGMVMLDGDQAHVMLQVHGLVADQDHVSHIHGFDNGTIATCPTQALDTNPSDGIISLTEGLPAYGAVQLGFDTLTPDAGGNVSLDQTFTLDATQMAALGASLADNAIVVHGLTVNGTYDASVPVACGLVTADDASTTYEADLTGANETTPVVTDATGSFVLRMDAGGASMSWQLIGDNFDEFATEAHIHDTATGDILYTLWFTEGNPFTGTGQISSGLITAADGNFNTDVTYAGLMTKIMAGEVYVNVHTAEHMDGYLSGAVYAYGTDTGS